MTTTTTPTTPTLLVISRYTPESLQKSDDGVSLVLTKQDYANDALDKYNHPRERRAKILAALAERSDGSNANTTAATATATTSAVTICFQAPSTPVLDLVNQYSTVHSARLVDFLCTAWTKWDSLGESGQDPGCAMATNTTTNTPTASSPPLIPINFPLHRDPHQGPSQSVMGQIGFYCTDNCTPIFGDLLEELQWDAAVLRDAIEQLTTTTTITTTTLLKTGDVDEFATSSSKPIAVYALPTHPGHHAATDSFGGYCYLNQAAYAAAELCNNNNNNNNNRRRVAVLDIDYHCGNGTASIFYDNPHVLVVSLHCDPDFDYPFHSGFDHQKGTGDGVGTTCHLPLPPQSSWQSHYQSALQHAMTRIVDEFQAEALIVSMGLDTHLDDPCALRRAGFRLEGHDYWEMGMLIGKSVKKSRSSLPTLFVQEGGYRMDRIGEAATNVTTGFCAAFAE